MMLVGFFSNETKPKMKPRKTKKAILAFVKFQYNFMNIQYNPRLGINLFDHKVCEFNNGCREGFLEALLRVENFINDNTERYSKGNSQGDAGTNKCKTKRKTKSPATVQNLRNYFR